MGVWPWVRSLPLLLAVDPYSTPISPGTCERQRREHTWSRCLYARLQIGFSVASFKKNAVRECLCVTLVPALVRGQAGLHGKRLFTTKQSKKFASIPLQHQWRVGECCGVLHARKNKAFLDRNGISETFGGPVLRILHPPCNLPSRSSVLGGWNSLLIQFWHREGACEPQKKQWVWSLEATSFGVLFFSQTVS